MHRRAVRLRWAQLTGAVGLAAPLRHNAVRLFRHPRLTNDTAVLRMDRSAPARIFRYVVRIDAGTAPRPWGGTCSLAICKPAIRASAHPGDWVIGFRSRRPGEVVYVMQIDERLSLGDYWRDPRYADRRPGGAAQPDNIYRPKKSGVLEQVANDVHGPAQAAADIRGRNVLLSKRFWYFGSASVTLPAALRHLLHSVRGHVVHKARRVNDEAALVRWLSRWNPGVHGTSIDQPQPEVAAATANAVVHRKARSTPGGCAPTARRAAPVMSPLRQLVLSRKGFDSGYGGFPSPILPDGRLVPLPIPAVHDSTRMIDTACEPVLLGELLADLGSSTSRYSLDTRVHLDPDLARGSRVRRAGWRPSLGQTGAAQAHLERCGAGPGTVFLFFGWFRRVERHDGRWRFQRSAPHQHVLFGWLEVDAVLPIVSERESCLADYPWIADHPHVANPAHYDHQRNTLYIARERSLLRRNSMGGGIFDRITESRVLTALGQNRSVWSLPDWFMASGKQAGLSYHGETSRWRRAGERCELRSVAKGQEFVLDLAGRPKAREWLVEVVQGRST